MAKKINQRLQKKRVMILKEAEKLLTKYGKNTSMGDIAQALGMDTSALYYYHKSIPEIIDTILGQKYHDFSLDNEQWQGLTKSPLANLKEMVTLILEFYYDNQEILQIILSQVFPLCLDPEHEDDSIAINHYLQTYRDANTTMLEQIKHAQEKKEIHNTFSPVMILQTIRGVIFGIWAAWKDDKPPRDEIPGIIEHIFLMFT